MASKAFQFREIFWPPSDDVPALRAAARRGSLLGYLIAGWLPFYVILHAILLGEGSLRTFIAGPRFVSLLVVTAGLALMMAVAGYGVARNSRICAFIVLLFVVAMISVGFFAFHALVPDGLSGGIMLFELCLVGVALGSLRAVLLLRRQLAAVKAGTSSIAP
jgi:hypothetical protein